MGGAVSSGHDNDDLIDNLKKANYIKTPEVERVFRIVDRAHYYLVECRDSAYKDLAWKNGTLHLSAPCIYSEVMESLELRKGLSFLNLGSGTGYLNTLVGLMIGPYGVNHGIELHADNVAYANKKLESFIQTGKKFDDLELCEPQFVLGNCLNLAPETRLYDRVYCGAACPPELMEVIQKMIKVNGILVVPVGDQLLKIKRLNDTDFSPQNVLSVSFASLILPLPEESKGSPVVLPDVNPMSLQCICRITIRDVIRSTFDFQLPVVDKTSNLNIEKHVKAPKFIRADAGRHPLNILPTARGLMLFAAFESSDEEEDERNMNTSERPSIRELNQQLRHYSSELHAGGRSAKNVKDDVDSDLSDMEDEEFISHLKAAARSENSSYKSSSSSHLDNQDVNMENVEENVVGRMTLRTGSDNESMEKNGNWARFNSRKSSEAEGSLNGGAPSHAGKYSSGKTDSILTNVPPPKRYESLFQLEKDSVSSTGESDICKSPSNDVLTPEFNARSPAIQVTPSVGVSVPGATKESYSVSADTSETSGFGSLGDDAFHMSYQQSGLGSLKDDLEIMTEEDFLPASSSVALNNKRSPHSKFSTGDSSVDYDSLAADSADSAWINIDTEDGEVDDDDTYMEKCKLRRIKNTAKKARNDDEDDSDDRKSSSPRGPDFSAFLRMKVESLPVPNSVKAFILHYRQTGQASSFDC